MKKMLKRRSIFSSRGISPDNRKLVKTYGGLRKVEMVDGTTERWNESVLYGSKEHLKLGSLHSIAESFGEDMTDDESC